MRNVTDVIICLRRSPTPQASIQIFWTNDRGARRGDAKHRSAGRMGMVRHHQCDVQELWSRKIFETVRAKFTKLYFWFFIGIVGYFLGERGRTATPARFQPRDATQSAVILSVRPSVRRCVTIRYHDHIGWNSSKIISRRNSVRLMCGLTPTWAI